MMTGPKDSLRGALRSLADEARDADLYGPAMRRARRIAHQRAAAGTVSALTALGLACAGLWYLAPPGGRGGPGRAVAISEPAPSAPTPGQPAAALVSPTPRPPVKFRTPPPRQPHPAHMGTATPRSRSLSDLPGRIFYDQQGGQPRVVLLDNTGDTHTVLTAAHSALGVSSDGRRIAYVQDGSLLIVDTDGGAPKRPYHGQVSDEQAPAWSPDGSRLLVDAADPAVLDLADGALEALPLALAGEHFRWSGDGSKLVYATPSCQLKVAGASESSPAVTVPVIGDPDEADNPSGLGACRPISVDATGSRVAVPLRRAGGSVAGSPVADAVANAVVDTASGDADPLPVSGVIVGAVFDADGALLVRAANEGKTTLSLFAPDGTLLVQANEPSGLRGLDLVAYTS